MSEQEHEPSAESGEIGARFRAGESAAAEQVRARVRCTLAFRGYGIPAEERRDLEQVVLAQIWEAATAPEFDPSAGFWAFVELVVARRSIDWMRTRRQMVPLDEAPPAEDPGDDPLAGALRRERDDRAGTALDGLPADCRELIRARIEGGRSYAELARRLGTTRGALRVRMHRCIQRAQSLLQEQD